MATYCNSRLVYPIVNLLSSTCINETKIRILQVKSKLLTRIHIIKVFSRFDAAMHRSTKFQEVAKI